MAFTAIKTLMFISTVHTGHLVQLVGLVEVTSRYFFDWATIVKKQSVKWVKPFTPNLLG